MQREIEKNALPIRKKSMKKTKTAKQRERKLPTIPSIDYHDEEHA